MRFSRVCRTCYRTLIVILIILLSALAYVTIVGFPAWLVEPYLTDFNQRNQIGAALGSVRFFPPDTIWIKDLRVEGARIDQMAFFECDDCWVKLDWSRLGGEPKDMISDVHVENGTINMRLYEDDEVRLSPKLLRFTNIDLQVARDDMAWMVNSLQARAGKVEIEASGGYYLNELEEDSERGVLEKYASTFALIDWIEEKNVGATIERWHREYDDWSWSEPVALDVEFSLYGGQRERDTVHVAAASDRMKLRDRFLEDVHLQLRYAGRKLFVDKISFLADGESFQGSCLYDLDSSQITGSVISELAGPNFVELAPKTVRAELESRQIALNGALEIDASFGPAALKHATRHGAGHLRAIDVQYEDIVLDNLSFAFERDESDVALSDMELALGEGEVSGTANYNLESKAFEGAGRARIDPRQLLPLVESEQLKDLIRSVNVESNLVKFEGECRAVLGESDRNYAAGDLEGKNFAYKGVDWDKFSCGIIYTNRSIAFNDFELVRPEGLASGRVAIDFESGTVAFNAVSGCDPVAVAGIVGQKWSERLAPFSFDGPVQISGQGTLNYQNFESSSLKGSASLRDLEYRGLLAERLEFNLGIENGKLTIDNISGRAFQGDLAGSAELVPAADADSNAIDYDLAFNLGEADLQSFVKQIRTSILAENGAEDNVEAYQGIFSSDVSVTGVYEDGHNSVENGRYDLNIKDGRLFEIRLLGGLSKYLSMIIPGFGYLSQTELFSSGLLRENRVLIQEVELRGGVVTVKGHGDYFYDHSLSVDVQVVPMRDGIVASLMRVVMFPVSKIFEFTLSGTLKEPEWKPKNLPKQLFLKFD